MTQLTEQLATFFADRTDVVAVYLFGSEARGAATKDSDVDVGVLYSTGQPASLQAASFSDAAALEEKLGRYVDLIDLLRASVDLASRVVATGQIVCDRDRSRRLRFEVDARNRYFDLKPTLDLYRRARRA